MQRWLAAFLAAFSLYLGSAQHSAAQDTAAALRNAPISALATEVKEDDSEFEVIFSRMDETATAAVFFGMIGAVANSAINNSEDDERAAPLRETAAAIDLDGIISEALTARLASRDAVQLASAENAASHTLVVEIGEWGLVRRAQLPDTSMRAFLKLNLSLVDARGRRVWGPQREHSVGQMSGELADFTPELLRTEMEELARRAGNQVANRIIYR